MKIYNITPVPKPRMTQSDRWKKRPATDRYWAFKDAVKLANIELPESNSHVTFTLPMPKSWSKKKRMEMKGKPHKQKPDGDNLLKALQDAIYNDDCAIWDIRITKMWGEEGSINIS